MARLAWFHCFAGIAGDMALGSLLDAGADLQEVRRLIERLPVRGWYLDAEPVLRAGVAATKARVGTEEDHAVRTAGDISGLLDAAQLPERVRERARAAFGALAGAEGRLHRCPPEQVHFHEVGGIDAIVDIVGTCAALEVLEIDEVRASAVATGTGTVRMAHGTFPNPAPAVMELLRGAPVYGREIALELTTPTGAALLAATAAGYGPLPAMKVEAVGFGAGDHEIDGLPNATQVVVGTGVSSPGSPRSRPLSLFEVNVDDVTGETVADVLSAVLDAGADSAWVTPIVMKKGRPAYTVSALTRPDHGQEVATVLARRTGSLGVRAAELDLVSPAEPYGRNRDGGPGDDRGDRDV